jgi:hypothetical protein
MKTPKSILPPEEDVGQRDLFIDVGNKTINPDSDKKSGDAKPPAKHELRCASSNVYFFNNEESEISR